MKAKTPAPAQALVFEPEFIVALTDLFENKIVFNHLLGLKITSLQAEKVTVKLAMRPDLVGHFATHRIHGGVISACIDAVGGLAILAANGARHMIEPPLERLKRFAKLGTIDLRVDYLRPGLGAEFEIRAEVLRLGSRVASVRMEFLDADCQLISIGTGAYIVS
ncbi:MAG: thioesterase family protein [Burkholderiaceae bacterium]